MLMRTSTPLTNKRLYARQRSPHPDTGSEGLIVSSLHDAQENAGKICKHSRLF